jgi:hypothetical protein
MSKQSKSFGATRAFRQHIVSGHGMGAEVRDLRADVEEAFQNNEAAASFPHLDVIDATSVVKAAGGDIVLVGRNLLQSQTFDTLTLGLTTAGIVLTCLKPGDSGIKVVIVQGVGALSAVLAAGTLTITLAAAGSTATQVVAAINGAASCIGVIFAAVLSGGGGTVLIHALADMAGGIGLYAGNKVWVAGVEALPKHVAAPWSDTGITVTMAANGDLGTGDLVAVKASSDGVCSETLTATVAAP